MKKRIAPLPSSGTPLPAGRYRILVADDDPIDRKRAVHLLETLGHTADLAENGRKAVAMHNDAPYDLIFMDCDMPELDGIGATCHIRSMEGGEYHPRIVALTACSLSSVREKCLAVGMDGFMTKPADLQELQQVLQRWLPDSPNTGESPSEEASDEFGAIRDMFGKDFPELAALYRDANQPRLNALRAALQKGDHGEATRFAHALGGSSASIGALRLAGLCKQLEAATKNGSLDRAVKMIAEIEAEYERVSLQLQAMLQ